MILLGVDEVEGNAYGFLLRKLHPQLLFDQLQSIPAYIVLLGVKEPDVDGVVPRHRQIFLLPLYGKGQMVRQGQIDGVRQAHLIMGHGIVHHPAGQIEDPLIGLGRQLQDVPVQLPVPEDKDPLPFLGADLLADGFAEANALAHKDDFTARLFHSQNHRIVQNFDNTYQ